MRYLIVAMTAVLSACTTATAPAPNSSNDRAAVYRAYLASWLSDGSSANVSIESMPIQETSERIAACAESIDFVNLNQARGAHHNLRSELAGAPRVRLVDPESGRQGVRQRDPDHAIQSGRSLDEAVDQAVAGGLLTLSEVAFDASHQHAVLETSFVCGALCGTGGIKIMDRTPTGEWVLSDRNCGGWVS